VHIKNSLGVEKRLEKGKAHKMIPMSMGEKEMEVVFSLGHKAVAKPAKASSGINYDYLIVFGADFQAGGVSPVNQIFRA
jgi:hypothetical protein